MRFQVLNQAHPATLFSQCISNLKADSASGGRSGESPRTSPRFRLQRLAGAWLLPVSAMFLWAAAAGAQVALLTPAYKFATPAVVGAAAEFGTAVVTISGSGSLGAIKVLMQGIANQDFTIAAGGSCSVGTNYFAGQTCMVAVSFQAKYPGFRQGAVVLLASNGNVLGTRLLSGTGVGATGVFVPGIISSVAGNWQQWKYRGDGGLATVSPLFLPMGGATDAAGDLYLSDSNNQRVRFVNAATGMISTIAGDGTAGFAGDGGPATSAQLDTPADVKLDGAGNYYIADSANHVIRMVNAATGIIWTVAGMGGQSGYSGDGGPATQAQLNSPSSIAFDGDHLLYISDTGNSAIRKVDLTTGIITTVAGAGTAGFSGDGGPATAGQLDSPWGIALGGDGSLYIADQSNNRVRKVSLAGVISTVAGTGVRGYGGDSGLATQAQLNVPAGVLVDVAGNLYVADSGNQLVRKVNATAGIIETIAGTRGGVVGNGGPGDGGPANEAGFDGPYALFLDGPGNLYIADMFNQLIRMVSSNVATLSYLPMRVGRVSAPQPEIIENDGNAALNFNAFNLVSNSALDAGSTTCVTLQPVAVDQTCVLGVAFAPTVTGTPVIGSLSVTSNAANSPGVIDLSGNVLSVNPTAEVLTSSLNPVALGTLVKFIATVSNSFAAAPTGTVTFSDGAVLMGAVGLDPTGASALSTATLATGSHTITAVYSGDLQNAGATSTLIETVEQPTTTKLASNSNPSVAGAPVTLTATVVGPTGSTGSPSGTVTFFDGATPIGQGTLNASGVATLAISTLSAGPRSITANYLGDALNLASQSAPLIETVTKAVTATSLATSNASVYAGVSVTFTSVVSRVDGLIPIGTVTFSDGAVAIGTGTINGAGTATLTTAALAGGTHSISAAYGGDANNLTSTSSNVNETVQPIATATTLAVSANPGIAGAALQLTATVTQTGATGIGGTFSGTVTFLDGGLAVGTASISAGGVAVLSVSTLAVGPHTISASYGGNANYVASASTPITETIGLATTSTVLVSSAGFSIAGLPLTLTATVKSNGGVATGVVTFTDGLGAGAITLGTGTLNASGIASISASGLTVGQHILWAVYGGDAKDNGSTSAGLNQVVQIATSVTTVLSSLNPSTFGASVTFTANVATNGGAATGTVTFSDGAVVLGTAAVNAGAAVFSTSALALGAHSITGAYLGDANDAASQSVALDEQVQQAGPVTLASSANPSIAGVGVTFTVTIAAPQGGAVTGTVTFKDGATTLGTANVNGAGVAAFSIATLAVGQHSIIGSYSGDTNNRAALSNLLLQTVQTAGTNVTLISNANPSLTNAALTLTSTVVGKGGSVTGTVTFQDGTTLLGASNLNAAGVATLVVNGLAPGLHSIVAVYSGDANNLVSTSPALAQSVLQSTTVSLSSSENPALALDAVTFTATVSNGGSKAPSGTVVFSDGTGAKVLGTVTLSAAGTATLTVASMTIGQHTISAAYGGDSMDLAGVSPGLSEPVQLRPTSDTLTASSTSLTGGQQVTLISVVRYAGPVTPTGTVSFLSSGVTLGTSVVDNTGVATITVNLLTSAPTVTASYSGDAVYAASTSTQTSITVAKPTQFTMQLNPVAVTMQSQQNSTTTLTLTSMNGFTDKMDLGCLGLPFAATCTFAQDQVALSANGVQTIQVVVDTGSPLTAGSQASLEQHGAGSLATMCILPGGALLGLAFWRGRRKMRASLVGVLMLLLLAGLSAGLSGCGGLHINGTPPGTYVFQVSATGLGTGVTQAIDVTMTVTQ
jgi:large repetitive protein